MTMEIKQGDQVRVSKDAPKLYAKGWLHDWCKTDSIVKEMDNEDAVIAPINRPNNELAIPTKYLVKVDAEAKEAKFKKGDMVRYRYDSKLYIVECKTGKYHYALRQSNGDVMMRDVLESDLTLYTEPTPKYKKGDRVKICSKNAARFGCVGTILEVHDNGTVDVDFNDYYVGGHLYGVDFIEPYIESSAPKIKIGDRVRCKNPLRLANSTDNDFIGIVTDAVTDGENGWFNVRMNNGATFQTYHESDLELIEPTEQTEAEKKPYDGLSEETANEISDMLEAYIKVLSGIADSFDWQRYAADLAKEVALKVANKYNNPEQAAEYAVSVAKAVVEGLKRK